MIWIGEINNEFVEKLLRNEPRELILSSVGGDLYAMLAAIDYLAENPVRIRATGLVASAAIAILAMGEKGGRSATPTARFMVHKPALDVASDNETVSVEVVEMNDLAEIYWQILSSKTLKRDAWWKKQCVARPWYFGEADARKVGLID